MFLSKYPVNLTDEAMLVIVEIVPRFRTNAVVVLYPRCVVFDCRTFQLNGPQDDVRWFKYFGRWMLDINDDIMEPIDEKEC